MDPPKIDPSEFTVGWISALTVELTAARGMLDEEYEVKGLQKHPRDTNSYCLGKIDSHKVVLCVSGAGNNDAGSAANHMRNTFEHLKFVLMVGIGGGVPSQKHDIRLGDVVVSRPTGIYPGVIQYDRGKHLPDGEFEITGSLLPPPRELLNAADVLVSDQDLVEINRITLHLENTYKRRPNLRDKYGHPGQEHDVLFSPDYVHQAKNAPCTACDRHHLVPRANRTEEGPLIHYGIIASGNTVMKDGVKRDQLGKQYGALCFEMEAAGLMNDFPCLVIRGICDYSDSHKNDGWHHYAAVTAAAYAKELLFKVPTSHPFDTSLARGSSESEVMSTTSALRSGPSSPAKVIRDIPTSAPVPVTPPQFFSPRLPSSRSSEEIQNSHISPLQTSPPSTNGSIFPSPPIRPESPLLFHGSSRSTRQSTSSTKREKSCDWDGRDDEDCIFESNSNVKLCESSDSKDPTRETMDQCECRVFDRRSVGYTIPTRRLVIRSLTRPQHYISHWMPPDNVHVVVQNARIQLWWSDCTHVVQRTRGYKDNYSCAYNPEKPHRTLAFEFGFVTDTENLATKILNLALQKCHYNQSGHRIEISKTQTVVVYKHDTTIATSEDCAEWHPECMILSRLNTPTESLRLFFPGQDSELDFRKSRCLDYICSLEKPSKSELMRRMDNEGGPDGQAWKEGKDLELPLGDHGDFTIMTFMDQLTPWGLLYFEDVLMVSLKGTSRISAPKKFEQAQVMLWSKSEDAGLSLRLIIRLSASNSNPWLTMSLSRSTASLTKPEPKKLGIEELTTCQQGVRLSIQTMTLNASSIPRPSPIHMEIKKVELHFKRSDHCEEFYDTVRRYPVNARRATTPFPEKPRFEHTERASHFGSRSMSNNFPM